MSDISSSLKPMTRSLDESQILIAELSYLHFSQIHFDERPSSSYCADENHRSRLSALDLLTGQLPKHKAQGSHLAVSFSDLSPVCFLQPNTTAPNNFSLRREGTCERQLAK